jgi:trans-aconitate methyltransferase
MNPDPIECETYRSQRVTFDAVAPLYDEMRPGYPQAVFDDLIGIAGVRTDSRLLEIGCGTGHATLILARRGFRIDCVDLGANMAALARKRLAAFDRVNVTTADFDIWNTDVRYGLIYLATAYHWLNPATRVERIARLLAPAGWLAVWRNHHVRGAGVSEGFFRAAQEIYAREAPALAAKFTGLIDSSEIPLVEPQEWRASGLFEDPQMRIYLWSRNYTASEYVRVLDTHSDHRMLPADRRERLFDGLLRLAGEFGGTVTREHATILHIAKKRN